jgi:hypothetical protein
MDWDSLTNAELLELSGGALAELRARGVVRTANAPAGDLAERLVADAMGGELAPNARRRTRRMQRFRPLRRSGRVGAFGQKVGPVEGTVANEAHKFDLVRSQLRWRVAVLGL